MNQWNRVVNQGYQSESGVDIFAYMDVHLSLQIPLTSLLRRKKISFIFPLKKKQFVSIKYSRVKVIYYTNLRSLNEKKTYIIPIFENEKISFNEYQKKNQKPIKYNRFAVALFIQLKYFEKNHPIKL